MPDDDPPEVEGRVFQYHIDVAIRLTCIATCWRVRVAPVRRFGVLAPVEGRDIASASEQGHQRRGGITCQQRITVVIELDNVIGVASRPPKSNVLSVPGQRDRHPTTGIHVKIRSRFPCTTDQIGSLKANTRCPRPRSDCKIACRSNGPNGARERFHSRARARGVLFTRRRQIQAYRLGADIAPGKKHSHTQQYDAQRGGTRQGSHMRHRQKGEGSRQEKAAIDPALHAGCTHSAFLYLHFYW